MKRMCVLAIGGVLSLSSFAQMPSVSYQQIEPVGNAREFRVIEISRNVQAVNYRHNGGATTVDMAGTDLLPGANGNAKVRSKRGTLEVEAQFGNLKSPSIFGSEYLTYVMWAISPEGRAVNLGEVLVGNNERSKLTATTDLQSFALIVSAEPYFAVRQPSNVVVLENSVRAGTKGTTQTANAKYELMERGGYLPTGYRFDPLVLSANLPLEFYEARNALRIAKTEGAEINAGTSYQHAVELMSRAEGYAIKNHIDKQQLIAVSRQAVQTAEDARTISVEKIDADRLAIERQASSDVQVKLQSEADTAMLQKEWAQSASAKAQAEMTASQTASDIAIATAREEADKSRLDAQQSRVDSELAQQGEQQAISDKTAMRARLSTQLNMVLATRDSARGLIVSMSDVLFDTGQYSLKSGAREKLAKVAGILIAYPGLNVEVDGYTDNVGGDEMNQTLSENRAGAVKDYLVNQSVERNTIITKGYGNRLPVATNETAAGRQENRRVELVVTGDAIGMTAVSMVGSLR